MTNHDDIMDTLNRVNKVQSVSKYLGHAAFYHRQKNRCFEKYTLFNVLCEIKENNISDEDLRMARLQEYTTGSILSLARIEQRLSELGWKG